MHVDRTCMEKHLYFTMYSELSDLRIYNLHNDSEENSKPGLSKEVIQNKTTKGPGWGEVQGCNSQRSSDKSAGRE